MVKTHGPPVKICGPFSILQRAPVFIVRLTSSFENFSSNNIFHIPARKSETITMYQKHCIVMDIAKTIFPAWRGVFPREKIACLRPGNARWQKWRAWERLCHAFPPTFISAHTWRRKDVRDHGLLLNSWDNFRAVYAGPRDWLHQQF